MVTATEKQQHTAAVEATLEHLAKLGGQRVQDDAIEFIGKKIILPESYNGRDIEEVVKFLRDWEEEQNNKFNLSRDFSYHPYDVAFAFQTVLKTIFGTTGFGRSTWSFFTGEQKPEFKSINVGGGETVQIPWGRFELPMMGAIFDIGYTQDRSGQVVGRLSCQAPKKFRSHIDGVFKAVAVEVERSSLFRGKAIDANWMDPEFLDLSNVTEDRVAYSDETLRQLNANIWANLEHTETIKSVGMNLKRAVLLEGPYGTGKSLTGYLTARKAIANGWTFVYCRPGQDLNQALHAAKLLAPSVVFFEDLDVVGSPGTADEADRISRLLDTFDGISNKANPILAVLTTNHVERLHKGMLRPGRLDAVVHIGHLDATGVRKLVQMVLPEKLRDKNMDYAKIAEAMDGFLPAFVKEAAERALRYSIARNGGVPGPVSTQDILDACTGLRPQLDLMTEAKEKTDTPALEQAFGHLIHTKINGVEVVDYDDDMVYKLSTNKSN